MVLTSTIVAAVRTAWHNGADLCQLEAAVIEAIVVSKRVSTKLAVAQSASVFANALQTSMDIPSMYQPVYQPETESSPARGDVHSPVESSIMNFANVKERVGLPDIPKWPGLLMDSVFDVNVTASNVVANAVPSSSVA